MTKLQKRYRRPDKRRLAQRKHMPSTYTMPTSFIMEVLNSHVEGMAPHSGKDYSHLIHEMRQTLHERMRKQAERQNDHDQAKRNKEIAEYERIKDGITCTQCHTNYPHDMLEKAFYRRAGSKRHLFQSECKRCTKERAMRSKELKKIKIDDIPF